MSKTLPPLITYYAQRIDKLGFAGLVFALLGLVILTIHFQHLTPSIAGLNQSLAEMKSQKNELRPVVQQTTGITSTANFLAKEELLNVLEAIQTQASKNNVSYDVIDYKTSNIDEVGLVKYEVDLPFNATYVNLKKFLYSVMQPYPNTVALTGISLYRNSAQDEKLEGHLQLSLYLKN